MNMIDLVTRIELLEQFSGHDSPISEKFNHPFSHVFIFGNMFPESHGFVAMPVASCIKDTCHNLFVPN